MPTPTDRIDQLGDDVKQQFANIGEELKTQLINDFRKILNADVQNLREMINNAIAEQNQRLVRQSQQNLQNTIKQQFGDSIFGPILGDLLIPGLLNQVNGTGFNNAEFRSSAAQGLLEIGKAIARSRGRNG